MKIGIVGLGLIGGSLAIDLRSQNHDLLGVSRQEATCKVALEKGIVDLASTDLSILKAAEIIFICTPMDKIAPIVEKLIPYLDNDTIVTDVGSVKQPIVEACSKLWDNFIGGHPMAGTAQQGINAAQSNLFQGAAYVFTPPDKSTGRTSPALRGRGQPLANLDKLKQLAVSLGAIPYICSPEVHDRAVAWISHLPVMVSAGLVAACLGETDTDVLELAQNLASSGFRDTSRVGGGNPELGTMMAQYNQDSLLRSLYGYRDRLEHIIELIETKNWDNLQQLLTENHQARPKFLN
ncbi:Prephenate dehydrogenase [Hyella patelloides LEGE 07179]|uniref:Prephenate dehydrogenase n=1 Tax=Hyella patelloides LEGE 07179 TaxID=945734 RepID=A0A563W3T2_9CYAN|nr:prephenate/arogenate dehydrogenase [Hyella patelloides]VEP18310.1 Prephenate dehydrogenase [Hyella patelloides LEGE 07179]